MIPGRVSTALAFAALALVAAAQNASACARPEDLPPLQTRAFQTELMVSALSCGESARYNEFVASFRPQLVSDGKALQAYFKREHGNQAAAQTDRFITQLANLASQRSSRDKNAFCAATKKLYGEVLALKQPAELKSYMAKQPVPVLPGVKSCAAN
ncbi:MAG: hypothetical protein ACKVOI_04085 [Dongiaceae bacterium]